MVAAWPRSAGNQYFTVRSLAPVQRMIPQHLFSFGDSSPFSEMTFRPPPPYIALSMGMSPQYSRRIFNTGRSLPGQNKDSRMKTISICSGELDSVSLAHKAKRGAI